MQKRDQTVNAADDQVSKRGHEIDKGDRKHPGAEPKKSGGLGQDYGQGIGYGGHSQEKAQDVQQQNTNRKPSPKT